MKINILEIPVYFISIDEEKTESMTRKLTEAGFTNFQKFDGLTSTQKITGCALSHRDVLTQQSLIGTEPFLILEDDVKIANMITEIEVPDDADALYVGTSKVGFYNGSDYPVISAERINEDLYRVYNMLATHSILYITSDYTKDYIRTTNTAIDLNIPHDIARAEVMKYWNVYVLNKPLFVQEGTYESYTNKNVDDIAKVDKLHANMLKRKKFR